MKLIITAFFLLLSYNLCSQDYIRGVIISTDDKMPVPNALVTAYDAPGKNILSYVFSSEDGTFTIKTESELSEQNKIVLEISFIGFEKKRVTISHQVEDWLLIELYPTDFKLNEIVVKAPKVSMRGDTLNFTVGQFVQSQDRNIGEVLKRIPGIEVEESGQIKYNDRPINSFYVDGKNLLGNQYGIATNNIKPNLVTMIQVFEKHEPIKALEDHSISESAAINLTIAKESRSKIIGVADLGLGAFPFIWNSRLTLFRFAEKQQMMSIFKSNNNGEEIGSEMNMLSMGAESLLQNPDLSGKGMLNLSEASSAPISSQRRLFNTSHLASVNLLIPIAKDVEATVKVNYIYDRIKNNSTQSTQFLIDGVSDITIKEESESKRRDNIPGIDLTVTANKKKLYFQNRINGRMMFSDREGYIRGSKSISQELEQRYYDVAEIFSIIKPLKKTVLRFNSRTQVHSLPELLNITSDSLKQQTGLFQVKSENTFSTQLRWKRIMPSISAGYNFLSQKLVTEINDGRDIPIFTGENEIGLTISEFFFTPSFRYEGSKLKASLSAPFKLFLYAYNNTSTQKNNSYFKTLPTAMLAYSLSRDLEVSAIYSLGSNSYASIQSMNPNYILNNYRILTKGYEDIVESSLHNFRLNLKYSNPLKLIYIGGGAMYSINKGGIKQSVEYSDFLSITKLNYDEGLLNSSLTFNGRVSKTFFDFPLSLRLSANHRIGNASYVQQSKPVEISSRTWNIEPSASYNFKDLVNSELIIQGSKIKRISNVNYESTLYRINASLVTSLAITGKLEVTAYLDYYYSHSQNTAKTNTLFADAKLSYKTGRGNLEFLIRNILNKNNYIHVTFSELSSIESTYSIRQRSFMLLYTIGF